MSVKKLTQLEFAHFNQTDASTVGVVASDEL